MEKESEYNSPPSESNRNDSPQVESPLSDSTPSEYNSPLDEYNSPAIESPLGDSHMAASKMRPTTMRLTPYQHEQLAFIAVLRGLSVNEAISEAIDLYIPNVGIVDKNKGRVITKRIVDDALNLEEVE